MKQKILNEFKNISEINNIRDNINFVDSYCLDGTRCDYPDCAVEVCRRVKEDEGSIGILICGTGIGISMAANKIDGIRCALCYNVYTAGMAKLHNNANVIALGGRVLNYKIAFNIINIFLQTKFEGGRHIQRLNKIINIENN